MIMESEKQRIFEVVKANTLKVLCDVSPDAITPDVALSDLGANSVDRVEVVMYSQEDLGLSVPPSELHGVGNLRGLVDVLYRHASAR
jgi:polyketide biosynthesis acyl carrier protein